jgi:nitrogen-specific signal transduction histidine kinase
LQHLKILGFQYVLGPGTHFHSWLDGNLDNKSSSLGDEVRARIFEPYFSTKKDGTGLGLAIVRRIIDDHQGTIRAHKNIPEGTRFVIEIPIQPTVEMGAGTENILKT